MFVLHPNKSVADLKTRIRILFQSFLPFVGIAPEYIDTNSDANDV